MSTVRRAPADQLRWQSASATRIGVEWEWQHSENRKQRAVARTPTHRTARHRSSDAPRRDHASFPDDPHGSLGADPAGHGDKRRVPRRCRSLPHAHGRALTHFHPPHRPRTRVSGSDINMANIRSSLR